MSYDYALRRSAIFTEGGQLMFLSIRDRAKRLLKLAGAARMQELIAGETGSSWVMQACVDRLVELGELRELPLDRPVAGLDRVFVAGRLMQ